MIYLYFAMDPLWHLEAADYLATGPSGDQGWLGVKAMRTRS